MEMKKEEVRMLLSLGKTIASDDTIQRIDNLQRLGIAYHFESEIAKILQQINNSVEEVGYLCDDIYMVSLLFRLFRLLRQEGFKTSSDVFKQLILPDEGKFNDELSRDLQGMLSLYEAAHFLMHGESILEEAISFTTSHLQLSIISSDLSHFLAAQAKHAVKQTIRKGLHRIEARHFISIYHEDPLHDEDLLRFAKLDFNNLQKLHRKEISDASRWWKSLDVESRVPYARDRLVEVYMYAFGAYFEPKFSQSRMITTKVTGIVSIINDTYDTHGTFNELQAFTDAVNRWDIKCIDQLPEYMKPIYQTFLDIYNEIDELMVKEGKGPYRIHYAKDIAKRHIQAYFHEAKVYHENYVPSLEDYMEIGIISCGYYLLTVATFLGLGEITTEEALKWLSNYPKIVRGSSTDCRLMDDIVSHKLEQERGHSPSSVECYVKQYGASEQMAYKYLRVQIAEAWKDINEEWLEPSDMPKALLIPAVNLARFMDALFKDESCYTKSRGIMKDTIKSLFIDHVPM